MLVKSTPKPSARRRGGRVKRDRTALVLRIDPQLAKWYSAAAEKQGRSRSQFMERWLEVLHSLTEHMEHRQKQGLSPFDAVHVVGTHFVSEMIRLGLANDLMKQAWELHLAQEDRREGHGSHGGGHARGNGGENGVRSAKHRPGRPR